MLSSMYIVALGNIPEEEFKHTRHNVAADMLCDLLNCNYRVINKDKIKIFIACGPMNNTGRNIRRKYGYRGESLLIIADDVETELGKFKLVPRGSARGHNGIRSILEHLQPVDYSILRIGVGRPSSKEQMSNFVLQKFSVEERQILFNNSNNFKQLLAEFIKQNS